jgi:capsule polysaccharide export protein KpsE/RkpR
MSDPIGSDGASPDRGRLPIAPFLEILIRRRRLVGVLTIGAAFCAAVLGLIWPVTYETSLTILPPEAASPFMLGAQSLESSLASLQIGFAQSNASALYADMLRSRSVRRYVIDKLDLRAAYGLDMPDTLTAYTYALDQLNSDTGVITFRNGLIIVVARAHTGFFPNGEAKLATRGRAAQIANALAEGLEVVNRTKNTNQAHRARLYLEGQIAQSTVALERAGTALAGFQREHMAISLDDQLRVGIENAGNLEAEVLAREVALGVARETMSGLNPEVRRLESEISSLREQLANMQRGLGASGTGGAGGVGGGPAEGALGLEQLPEIGRQYALRLRDVKIQERLYELLTEQLYQARIKETETLPVIQVLDEAVTPVFKKSPIVRKVTLIAGMLGFFAAVLLAYALTWWERYEWRAADAAVVRRLWRRG